MNVPRHPPPPDPADLRWAALAEAETLGDPLTPQELAFLRMHVPTDPALRIEQAMRGAMERWGEPPMSGGRSGARPGEDDEAVLAAAVAGHLQGASEGPRAGRVAWLVAAGLAAAAAVVLAVVLGADDEPARSDAVAQVEAPASEAPASEAPAQPELPGSIHGISGTWVDEVGAPLVGAPVPGTVLTAKSDACLGDRAGGRLCVEPGARVRAVAAEAPTLEWLEGRGELVTPERSTPRAMVLEVRVAGMHVSGPGASTVAVEATTDGHWSLTVREGEVSLQTPEGPRTLTAGEHWSPEPGPTGDGPSRAATPDAATLLRQARAARADGSMTEAAALYRRLLRAYPRSSSSGPAWVALGQVELARGRARAALEAFDRYLGQGGALAEEAAYGRIEALHALGRTADERAATERFLAKYPGSSYAAKLRRRP